MWLAKQLIPAENAGAVGGKFALDGQTPMLEVGEPLVLRGVLTPYGYYAVPPVCSDAAAIPVEGEYLLAGTVVQASEPAAGEILIRSAAGGYIHLQANGEIVLNGVRITTDGRIITPTA